MPIKLIEDNGIQKLLLAITDPDDHTAKNIACKEAKIAVKPALVSEEELNKLQRFYYDREVKFQSFIKYKKKEGNPLDLQNGEKDENKNENDE